MKKLLAVIWVLALVAGSFAQCPIKSASEKIAFPLICLDTLGRNATPDSVHITTYKDDATFATFFTRSTTFPFSAVSVDTTRPGIGGTAPVNWWFVETISNIDGTATNATLGINVQLWWKGYATDNRYCVQMVADSLNDVIWKLAALTAAPLEPTTAGRKLDVSTGGEAGLDWANIGSPTTSVALSGTSVLLTSGTGTGQISLASGAVTVGTNNDKTGYSLATAPPDSGVISRINRRMWGIQLGAGTSNDSLTLAQRQAALSPSGSPLNSNAIQLSGDATAADNSESFFDGTGYAGTNNVIPLVTTTTTATNVTTVNGLAANVITATSIATDAITANKIAAGAIVAGDEATGFSTLTASDNIGLNWGDIINPGAAVTFTATDIRDVTNTVDATVSSMQSNVITAAATAAGAFKVGDEIIDFRNFSFLITIDSSSGADPDLIFVTDTASLGTYSTSSTDLLNRQIIIRSLSGGSTALPRVISSLTYTGANVKVTLNQEVPRNFAAGDSIQFTGTMFHDFATLAMTGDSVGVDVWATDTSNAAWNDNGAKFGEYNAKAQAATGGTASIDTASIARSVWDNDVVALAGRTTTTAAMSSGVIDDAAIADGAIDWGGEIDTAGSASSVWNNGTRTMTTAGTVSLYPLLWKTVVVDAAGAVANQQFVIDTTDVGTKNAVLLTERLATVRNKSSKGYPITRVGWNAAARETLQISDTLCCAIAVNDTVDIWSWWTPDMPTLAEAAGDISDSTALKDTSLTATASNWIRKPSGATATSDTASIKTMLSNNLYAAAKDTTLKLGQTTTNSGTMRRGEVWTPTTTVRDNFSEMLDGDGTGAGVTVAVDTARNATGLGGGSSGCPDSTGFAVTLVAFDSLNDATVADAQIILKTSPTSSSAVAVSPLTAASGAFTFTIGSAGTYYALYRANGQICPIYTLTFTGDVTDTVPGYAFSAGTPTSPTLCRVYGWATSDGWDTLRGATISLTLVNYEDTLQVGSVAVGVGRNTVKADANGFWWMDVIPNALLDPNSKYLWRVEHSKLIRPLTREVIVPESPSTNITSLY